MSNIYAEIIKHLDYDERLIYHYMYKKTPWLYDKVKGTIYLIRCDDIENAPLEWVWDRSIEAIVRKHNVSLLAQLLYVRVRDRSSGKDGGFIISAEEYHSRKNRYIVLEVGVVAAETEYPNNVKHISKSEYEQNITHYEFLEFFYHVRNEYPEVQDAATN